jgi:hypothetical protein
MGAVTVNPVQTSTYYLNVNANPITFGAATNIDVSPDIGVVGNGAASWTVTNAGAINAPALGDLGIFLANGGTVNNLSGGTISGGAAAVQIQGGSGVITNAGVATGGVVIIARSGNVTNLAGGMISAGNYSAVYIGNYPHSGGNGTVTNAGAISSTDSPGVILFTGGTIKNQNGGTISGGNIGVYITGGAGSVTNAGTISGGLESVEFRGTGGNTLTLQSGSVLTGAASGSTASGATNALVLEGEGTADNNFDNFNTLTVKASGDWTLGGDSTIGAATVSSLATLTVTGDLEITGNFANAHDVLVSSGTLDLEGAVTGKGADEVSGAAILEFGSTVTGNVVDFTGPSTVELIDPTGFAGRFESFASMDTVDMTGDWIFQKFTENAGATVGTLTLENVATNADLSLKFEGDYTRRDFTITPGTTTTTIT